MCTSKWKWFDNHSLHFKGTIDKLKFKINGYDID